MQDNGKYEGIINIIAAFIWFVVKNTEEDTYK